MSRRYPLASIILAGVITLIAWAGVFLLFFSRTLWHSPSLVMGRWPGIYYAVESELPWQWLTADRSSAEAWPTILLWLGLAGALFAAWWWAASIAGRSGDASANLARWGLPVVLAVVVCATLMLVFSPGLTSSDVYGYIWYGHIAGVIGTSPYTHAPIEFSARDPGGWLALTNWDNEPTLYGPAWLWPAAGLARLVRALHGALVNQVLVQRAFAAELHFFNTLLVWSLAGKLLPVRGARLAATIFYGWCPLAVWEFANNAHNDALLVFWVLVALWFHLQGARWWRFAAGALVLAGLVKLTGFLLLPAYVVLVAAPSERGGLRRLLFVGAQAVAILVAIGALLYAPFWDGPQTLTGLFSTHMTRFYANSFAGVSRWALGTASEGWIRVGLLIAAVLLGSVATLRVRDTRSLLTGWAWVLLAYLMLGTVWFWPWYICWLLPIVGLLGPGRLRTAAALYALGGMAFYGLSPVLPPPFAGLIEVVPLACFGPAALYVAWTSLRRLRFARRVPATA